MCGCNNRRNNDRREEAICLIEKGVARIREGLCEIKRCCICAGVCEIERGLADILAGLKILKKEEKEECEINCNCNCR